MKQFQDLVTLAPWTFIFQICNLLILTAGVKHFLFKPVQQILAKRKEEIEASYTEAEQAESQAAVEAGSATTYAAGSAAPAEGSLASDEALQALREKLTGSNS